MKKVYQAIASSFNAMLNCEKSGNSEWYEKHNDKINDICDNYMPHGSGFDSGTKFDFDKSKPEKLVFNIDYHHMDYNGYYDGWSEMTVTITPSLQFDFNMRITGLRRKNRFDMDYMFDTINYCLNKEI